GGRSKHPIHRRRIEAERVPPPPRTAVSGHAPRHATRRGSGGVVAAPMRVRTKRPITPIARRRRIEAETTPPLPRRAPPRPLALRAVAPPSRSESHERARRAGPRPPPPGAPGARRARRGALLHGDLRYAHRVGARRRERVSQLGERQPGAAPGPARGAGRR